MTAALITGITGQDGAYLAELLLRDMGYTLDRDPSMKNRDPKDVRHVHRRDFH